MEKKIKDLTLQELAAFEQIINAVCRKYENIAQMNKFAAAEIDQNNYQRAANLLSYFNNKRNEVLDEMEARINEILP